MKLKKSITLLAALAIISLTATGCKGRTTDTVEPTGDTVEVTPMDATTGATDSMNHDAEAVTLPDSIEVPE